LHKAPARGAGEGGGWLWGAIISRVLRPKLFLDSETKTVSPLILMSFKKKIGIESKKKHLLEVALRNLGLCVRFLTFSNKYTCPSSVAAQKKYGENADSLGDRRIWRHGREHEQRISAFARPAKAFGGKEPTNSTFSQFWRRFATEPIAVAALPIRSVMGAAAGRPGGGRWARSSWGGEAAAGIRAQGSRNPRRCTNAHHPPHRALEFATGVKQVSGEPFRLATRWLAPANGPETPPKKNLIQISKLIPSHEVSL